MGISVVMAVTIREAAANRTGTTRVRCIKSAARTIATREVAPADSACVDLVDTADTVVAMGDTVVLAAMARAIRTIIAVSTFKHVDTAPNVARAIVITTVLAATVDTASASRRGILRKTKHLEFFEFFLILLKDLFEINYVYF